MKTIPLPRPERGPPGDTARTHAEAPADTPARAGGPAAAGVPRRARRRVPALLLVGLAGLAGPAGLAGLAGWAAVAGLAGVTGFAALALPTARAANGTDGPALLELSSFPRSTLTIHSATRSEGHVFRVWVADTPQRHQQGLMYVRDLPAEEGMLFFEREPRVWGMWMKNTYIPLDMLFIDARGRVVAIFERTVPHSLQTLSWPRPVKGILELRGGETARRGIRVGDRVEHPAFLPRS